MPTGPVFISHSSRDAAVAHEPAAALEAGGVACWISGRDVAPGANYQEAIVGAIAGARALVLLLTEAANALSTAVEKPARWRRKSLPVLVGFPCSVGGRFLVPA